MLLQQSKLMHLSDLGGSEGTNGVVLDPKKVLRCALSSALPDHYAASSIQTYLWLPRHQRRRGPVGERGDRVRSKKTKIQKERLEVGPRPASWKGASDLGDPGAKGLTWMLGWVWIGWLLIVSASLGPSRPWACEGPGVESRQGGLLHGPSYLDKDTGNDSLRSLTASGCSPAAAEEPMLGKGASAENVEAPTLSAGSLSLRGKGGAPDLNEH